MSSLSALRAAFDGEVITPEDRAYHVVRRPAIPVFADIFPHVVLCCRSVADVVAAIAFAHAERDHVAVRSGGHCFAGRSSTRGILIDVSGMADIRLDDGIAAIGAGARLGDVYAALHAHRRTLPAGCGPTVGIAGLTLGGGIGLLGRRYGLTCDRLLGAQVVLADGSVVDCDHRHDPDLFWALRGGGGGQFGVVTSLRFAAVDEPLATRIDVDWPGVDLAALSTAWQRWALDAPDDVTVGLTLTCGPAEPLRATMTGLSTLDLDRTRDALHELTALVGTTPDLHLSEPAPYQRIKIGFDDPHEVPVRERLRSEFFSRTMSETAVRELVALIGDTPRSSRRLTFTAMGGAYNRVAADATAFAHRSERYLLEHVSRDADPWVDHSWTVAHAEGSGHVYPNFPDRELDDADNAYYGGNRARLAAVKRRCDPGRFFDFPQAIR